MSKSVLVCGGRDFYDWKKLSVYLGAYHDEYGIEHLIHGNACGADWLAKAWAHFKGIPQTPFPADWKTHKYAAGAIRNKQMLDEGSPDLVVAFPGGNGTKDMIRQAKKAGVEVLEVS